MIFFLQQQIDVMNVVVIVTRWYGGIHLGPDRFKHINSVARDVLLQQGFIQQGATTGKKKKEKH